MKVVAFVREREDIGHVALLLDVNHIRVGDIIESGEVVACVTLPGEQLQAVVDNACAGDPALQAQLECLFTQIFKAGVLEEYNNPPCLHPDAWR